MAGIVTPLIQTQVAELYVGFFGRSPLAEGMGYWGEKLANGATPQQLLANEIQYTPEYMGLYAGKTPEQQVITFFRHVFDRDPLPAGVTYWAAKVNATTPFYDVAWQMVSSVYAGAPGVDPADTALVQNKVAVSKYYSIVLSGSDMEVARTAFDGVTQDPATVVAKETEMYVATNTYTLTTSPETATAQFFSAPQAYTPGGNDLVNTLQNEDVLTGDTSKGATSLTGTLGNNNDNGYNVIAPTINDVDTININFSATYNAQTLDFQDIAGTETANITRISNDLRQSFVNLDSDVATLGIANTSEQAKATITYLNNELAAANNAVTVNLNNVSLSNTQGEYDFGGAALKIEATQARGSDLQNQIETYNVVTSGVSSSIATFATGISSFDDLVVGERPVTVNVNAGANLSVGTLRWLGNRLETNSANAFQQGTVANVPSMHLVGTNGLGFTNFAQINLITYAGSADLSLANVGTWETEVDVDSDIDFTLNAATATGNLTANISNAAMSSDATFIGGLGSDRFYAAGRDTFSSGTITPVAVEVDATISGGAGVAIDTLTVQSNAGTTQTGIDLRAGSANLDVLNAVQGIYTAQDATWNIDLADGGFQLLTFNNQDTAQAMNNVLANFNASTTDLSIRSTGLNAVGDPDTTAQGAVGITFSQAAGLVGGTLDLNIGDVDDRSLSDAFSFRNYTSTVTLQDLGSQVTEVSSLNLVVDSAGANGTGALQLNVYNDDFETSTQLTTDAAVGATNTVNIGYQVAANSSDYAAAGAYPANGVTNALNSTVYAGGAYTGTQNVTFGSAFANQAVVKSHTIATGSGNNDTVDLSYMGTNTARTAQGYAISSFLLNTMINMGGGTGDELILSASLADPRVVVNADITYDGYFANWSNVDTLTINNRNALGLSGGTLSQGATNSYVALDAYAQINNSGLNTINWNDVSGELAVGFRFTNALTINADATGVGTNERGTKWTTLNSFSTADNTTNIDASAGIAGAVGNLVQYTNTGANLLNNVFLSYNNIDNSGANITSLALVVQNSGSVDYVDFNGDLGLTAAAGGDLTVTAPATWVAANQLATFDASSIINTQASDGNATVTIDMSLEVNALGLTILGSTDGGSATVGVNNVITGGASVANTITSEGYQDVLTGGSVADTITYTGNSGVTTNAVAITAGAGNDIVNLFGLTGTETSTVIAGAGNDTVNLSLGVTDYNFASVAVQSLASAAVSTVAEMIVNVGQDAVSGLNVTTGAVGADRITVSEAVFGTDIGNPGTHVLDGFQQVVATSTILATSSVNSIVAVQTGVSDVTAGTSASLYYVQPDITAGQSIDVLVQSGQAILIGQLTGVTGLLDVTDFYVTA